MTSSTPARLTWDEVRTLQARQIASRSLCERDQVGAIIVNRQQRIIAEGYNGPPAGFDHSNVGCSSWCHRAMFADATGILQSDYSDCPALHAEANALMVCDRKDREGGTIYVTSGVCWNCAKLIANSGLATVVIDEVGDPHGHRNAEKSYRFLEQCGITVVTG